MPASQLKQLKSSLREKGITGPQKSKKQKKKNAANPDARAKRSETLADIREKFNPYEVKTLARPKKFEATTFKRTGSNTAPLGRPGVSKSMGEEARRKTLLPEMHRRHKVGGIVDRRFGENNPTMTPEERALERFAQEQARKNKRSTFNLEEDEEEEMLTHGGRSISFADEAAGQDDFDAGSLQGSDDEEDGGDSLLRKKRSLREFEEEAGEEEAEAPDQPERKRSRAEIMKEVMNKAKLYKYERQKAKEDDEELREELDKGLPDLLAILRGKPPAKPQQPLPSPPESGNDSFGMNPERARLLAQSDKDAGKEYDRRLKELAQDERAKPTTRTKTEEEKAGEEAKRLKELEERRLRRMRGEQLSDDESDTGKNEPQGDEDVFGEELPDDAVEFGFASTAPTPSTMVTKSTTTRPEGVDDEDDFIMDEGLVASGSDLDTEQEDEEELAEEDEEEDEEDEEKRQHDEEEEDEFVRGLLSKDEEGSGAFAVKPETNAPQQTNTKLAYTYACPRSHEELLEIFKNVPISDTATVVQRIRALYHPQLSSDNKEKLSDFSAALVDHISYTTNQFPPAPLAVSEQLIRHLHSLSRSYAAPIARAFRTHLQRMLETNSMTAGDLTMLTAIGTIYPTSDHFHQVVTPAITLMARWLGMNTPKAVSDLSIGAYLAALCLQYQSLSKRYIPELIRFTSAALKSPLLQDQPALRQAYITSLTTMADTWKALPSFVEIFTPILPVLSAHGKASTKAIQHIRILLSQSTLSRRPLELHHHVPLAIKTSLPKFESTYQPGRHYDPDNQRSEAARFKKEFRRERKGAMRELRKDSRFIAREDLREKKERDRAYETKFKRLVAEIQGEEGRENKEYQREKRERARRRDKKK